MLNFFYGEGSWDIILGRVLVGVSEMLISAEIRSRCKSDDENTKSPQ